ncbi:dGTPase [Alteromonas sp. KS69]|jgi:dGTPase|uniref:dGTPase n=1 Tax=Alteromonas sp. KS69 TaxID=2109917 RepID=UPI000F87D313|nr:dGTPase [Alteromonas sp. KS69]RUP79937.1 dGTPase [Alteromonas sp. KS69]|tara:strand:- start:401 stop:1879 length:1479 start_codon:yes stop_codon:yes gene_type:complete
MDYNEKLKHERFRASTAPKETFDEEMESDRGRSINSAAVRRLQQKTQVFPLESNAAVRSRLTHSLEVQQVGRYIAKLVLKKLNEADKLKALGLDDKKDGFTSAIEIACLLHDVGNPAFGHFGEEAINMWSETSLLNVFTEKFGDEVKDNILVKDLLCFEGNAQAIRLLHSLQDLNLSFSQVACLIKYTRPAYEPKPTDKSDLYYYRKKKPGYYYSEEEYVKTLQSNLNIESGNRFPLTYIMEAADDISYCIADLDDALDKGILNVDQLHKAINDIWDSYLDDEKVDNEVVKKRYLPNLAKKAYKRYESESHNKNHSYILTLRTILVNELANYASYRYIENHEAVFDGTLDESLLDGNDEFHLATEVLKDVASKYVFSAKEVERLELQGHAIISGLLDAYMPLLKLDYEKFKSLSKTEFLKPCPIETRLYHDLSNKHKRHYSDSVKSIHEQETVSDEDKILELYYRSRLLIDYISGMTDRFAFEEYRSLKAID